MTTSTRISSRRSCLDRSWSELTKANPAERHPSARARGTRQIGKHQEEVHQLVAVDVAHQPRLPWIGRGADASLGRLRARRTFRRRRPEFCARHVSPLAARRPIAYTLPTTLSGGSAGLAKED